MEEFEKGQMTASEAVFGFAAWLTCRKEAITIGATHDAAPMADFVKRWCDVNNLPPVREGVYPHNITQPPAGWPNWRRKVALAKGGRGV